MACGLQVNLIHFTEGASGTISGGENLRIWQSVEYRQASYNVKKREGPRIIFCFHSELILLSQQAITIPISEQTLSIPYSTFSKVQPCLSVFISLAITMSKMTSALR
ncbi:hypothetical protein CPSG_08275 [Coccidioides posadasii str. Silveira]|uniref:Uncharacterized protein n=1 Tax=Coccidioides posadasii (strain RMSCC 757 / Silveira) TaxID=443226 RepID=E9DEM5_COCPS|nr:hypothetical protein CPSG_08275 [Coccidioides posadasii str. Silveira]